MSRALHARQPPLSVQQVQPGQRVVPCVPQRVQTGVLMHTRRPRGRELPGPELQQRSKLPRLLLLLHRMVEVTRHRRSRAVPAGGAGRRVIRSRRHGVRGIYHRRFVLHAGAIASLRRHRRGNSGRHDRQRVQCLYNIFGQGVLVVPGCERGRYGGWISLIGRGEDGQQGVCSKYTCTF